MILPLSALLAIWFEQDPPLGTTNQKELPRYSVCASSLVMDGPEGTVSLRYRGCRPSNDSVAVLFFLPFDVKNVLAASASLQGQQRQIATL